MELNNLLTADRSGLVVELGTRPFGGIPENLDSRQVTVEVCQMASAGSPPRKSKFSRDEREVRSRKKESNRPQSSRRY